VRGVFIDGMTICPSNSSSGALGVVLGLDMIFGQDVTDTKARYRLLSVVEEDAGVAGFAAVPVADAGGTSREAR